MDGRGGLEKLLQDPRFVSRRQRHIDIGRGLPLALGDRTFRYSTTSSLTRGKRKFINSRLYSTLTTKLCVSPPTLVTEPHVKLGEHVASCVSSHSETSDECGPEIELACSNPSGSLGLPCGYPRSTSAPSSSSLRNCETINTGCRAVYRQLSKPEPTAFGRATMGSLFKIQDDDGGGAKKRDTSVSELSIVEESPTFLHSFDSSCISSREGIIAESLSEDIVDALTRYEVQIGQARPAGRQQLCAQMSVPSSKASTSQFRRQLSKRTSVSHEILSPHPQQQGGDEEGENSDDEDTFHSISGSQGNISDPCTPTSPKTRRVENYDPYQIFEVQHSPCLILTVKVLQGRNITMGFQDYYDTPDPYISLIMRSSPEGKKTTTVKENNQNPVWNEIFTFFINFTQANVLEISLMESNSLWFDQKAGTVFYDLVHIREMDKPQTETFVFNEVSQVDIEFKLEFDRNPTLRYSLCLCPQEKDFMERRKEKILEAMRKLLGDEDGPQKTDEVPTIAVIGSGGGFRAMTGFSGVFKALVESGVLGCTMYAGGLSGSSWLLSTLYSHPKWPSLEMQEFLEELKLSTDKSLFRFLNASTMCSYIKFMIQKRREGQPVSFTDIFGRMVGETLLTGRMEATLSDQREKIKDATVPMPLYTCVHVKKDVPARSFQEWVEFSPYEIGMPKYGTFMSSELFGSKFFMGKLVKQYKEQPLHFLQGVWGSAFCILFKRLLEENHHIDSTEKVRQEMGDQLDEAGQDSFSDCSDDEFSSDSSDSLDSEPGSSKDLTKYDEDFPVINPSCLFQNIETELYDSKASAMFKKETDNNGDADKGNSEIASEVGRQISGNLHRDIDCEMITKEDCVDGSSSCDGEEKDDLEGAKEENAMRFTKIRSLEMKKAHYPQQMSNNPSKEDNDSAPGQTETFQQPSTLNSSVSGPEQTNQLSDIDQMCNHKKSVNWGEFPTFGKKVDMKQRRQAYISATSIRKSRSGSKSYWKQLLKGIFESNSWELLSTRRGRAAVIHNFMRGLSLQQSYPLSPFTPVEERVQAGDEFDGIFEMHPTDVKNIYMVDAGLTFNSPYPLILRPQRAVDIILSFDFSARPSDAHPPFKELLLAEKWARLNRLQFPPIDTSVFDKDGMKELYIFRHPTDPHCPVVFHFPLINQKFKYYKKPEIARETKEEFDFAEFNVFDDPRAPYSTFNFTYTHNDFERLSQLMEFNTLLHINSIKEVMTEVIKRKREGPPRHVIQSRDVKLLRKNSMKQARRLRYFISRMESKNPSHSPSTPSFYTPTANGELSINPFFAGFQRKVSRSTSDHTNILNSKRSRHPESFHNSNPFHLIDLFSNYGQLNSIEKKDFARTISYSPKSPTQKNMYSTPPDSANYFHQPEETFTSVRTNSVMSHEPIENNLDITIDQKSMTYPENTTDADLEVNLCVESISTESKITTVADENSLKNAADVTGIQNASKRPLLSQKMKLPGTSEFTPSKTVENSPNSSGYNSLSIEIDLSWDKVSHSETNADNSGKITFGSGVFSPEETNRRYLDPDSLSENFRYKRKLKKKPPPNPFFTKAFFMRSPYNSSSTSDSSSLSLISSEDGDDTNIKSSSEISDEVRQQLLQPSNPTENRIIHNFNESLDTQPSQQGHANNRLSQDEAEPSSSQTTPEIFTLAPEAFKSDGTPVFDPQEAKMFYESAKGKRKLFHRQSTVSSLQNISLEDCQLLCRREHHGCCESREPESSFSTQQMTHSNTHLMDFFSKTSVKDVSLELNNKNKMEISNNEMAPVDYRYGVNFEISDLSQFSEVKDSDMQ